MHKKHKNAWSLDLTHMKGTVMISTASFSSINNLLVVISVIIIGTYSLVHGIRSGGAGGRIIVVATMLAFAYVAYGFIYDVSLYGDRVFEVRENIAHKNADLAIQREPDDSTLIQKIRSLWSPFSENVPKGRRTENSDLDKERISYDEVGGVPTFDPVSNQQTKAETGHYSSEPVEVVLSQTPSTPVTVAGGLCIATWQTDRDTLNYSTEVLPVGSDQWIIFTGGPLRIKKMRWYGEGTMAYQLRKDGSC